ncbi:MAG: hypothetical protein ACRDN0_20385, partial [Trebonia sp.]
IVTMLNAMTQGNDGSLSTIHANSSLEVFNRIATYALQATERLPIEASHMLIAGAIDFVVFQTKRNDYAKGGRLRRFVSSVREVTGVDGRVLSSEVFTPGPDGRALPHAPVSCAAELAHFGYVPGRGGWLWVPSPSRLGSPSSPAALEGPGSSCSWSRSAACRASSTRRVRASSRSGCARSSAGAERWRWAWAR